jgi:hypothetical protein
MKGIDSQNFLLLCKYKKVPRAYEILYPALQGSLLRNVVEMHRDSEKLLACILYNAFLCQISAQTGYEIVPSAPGLYDNLMTLSERPINDIKYVPWQKII